MCADVVMTDAEIEQILQRAKDEGNKKLVDRARAAVRRCWPGPDEDRRVVAVLMAVYGLQLEAAAGREED
jgi:hypothetical protein